jgi:EAL domain-containing protein (putative c-di-GMP-specific phosphodiesterase class I)
LQEAALTRANLTRDLRGGLAANQFAVVYQPIIDLATGAIHKAEALIRWEHPTRGQIQPAAFIGLAESSGLIIPIGQWVLEQAAAQVAQWRRRHHPQFQISVNTSPVQFHGTGGIQAGWFQALADHGLPGESLVVEITEGLLLDAGSGVSDQLLDLRRAGIQISLDDFGTGFSSLTYLQKFDIDYVKIDQSFVRNLAPASRELSLCKAIIVMAHELGMQVVAEGVETTAQHDLLLAAGCDFGQGFLYARPMPAPALDDILSLQDKAS